MSIVLPQSEMEKQTNQKKNRGGRVQQNTQELWDKVKVKYIYI